MAFRECTTAEKDIGMLYYLSGADGTGGRLKARAEDFVVEEVSKGPERAENGKYTIATVKATNWESNRMIRLFAREMGMSRERIGFAGTKDKRAVTTQLMSFECPPSQLEKVQLKDVEFSDIYTARRNIRIGDLVGNRFRIRVTGCSRPADEIASIVGEVAADIKANKGFPNYFGVQRFGVMRPITHLVGERLVRGDIEGAVKCYVCTPSSDESRDKEAAECRKNLSESDDWASLLNSVPDSMSFEKVMVQHMAENPGDWTGAIAAMPTNLQMMFVHAYQSYLFNIMLSRRIEKGLPMNRPVVGDVIVPMSADMIPLHEQQIVATEKNIDLVERQVRLGKAFVTGCLFGSDSQFAEGEMGEIERRVIEDNRLKAEDFIIPGLPHCSSEGDRREILCPVKDLTYEPDPDGYIVSFFLPKGNYATCLMREFMKSEMTDY